MGVILGYYQDQIPLFIKGWNSECVPPWEYSRKMFCSWKSKSKDKNLFYSHIKEQKLNKNRFPDWLIFSWSEAIDRDVINGSSHIQENRARFLKLLAFRRADARLTLLYYAILGKSYSLLQCRCSCQFFVHSSLYCAVVESWKSTKTRNLLLRCQNPCKKLAS